LTRPEEQPLIPVIAPGSAYRQTNFISDLPGVAFSQDPLLVNPWGITFRGTSPFWVANNATSTSTLYRGDVAGSPLVKSPGLAGITIPGGLPTGTVGNATSDFVVTSGPASGAANFLFSSITGNISGWNPNVPAAGSTTAVIMASHPGHVYTGLAIGNNGANLLYAADFANDSIDVFNASFALTTVPGGFTDPTIPAGFHPFNIQNLGGQLYVAYAKVGPDGRDEEGVGNGFVRRFDANGVRDLTFGINNGPLNSPWGLVIAPASFGIFGGALLVGNFGAGNPSIHAFNPNNPNDNVVIPFSSGVGGSINGKWDAPEGNGTTLAAQLSNLREGRAYVNFHTTQFPGGEIRGNIPAATAFRDALTAGLNGATETRATVLRKVAEQEELKLREFNAAFVLMEYFGFLRRDPDTAGFNFWLNKLNAFNGDFLQAEMVKAFITSLEYRQRFGA
jgi:uncharacterized protein (TIGR03118 family)